ncbi:MAG: permease [Dehalococcoidia bacterium]|nr:permease [Dehalococcoidia bacterium]
MELFIELMRGGLTALREYLSAHVLTCLVPAFFIAGAIAVFVSQGAILRYFGPQAKKAVSYGVASISGAVLSVCSCTVLPMFGGIYKRGAGLGPAIAFLYSGPAINVLAIVLTARLLGFDLGLARAIGAVAFAGGIGLVMALAFRKEERARDAKAFALLDSDPPGRSGWQQLLFFGSLLGILLTAAAGLWIPMGLLLALLAVILWRWFEKGEMELWMRETLHFVRLIAPWLLVGVFAAGMLTVAVPSSVVTAWVGTNSLLGNFMASLVGSVMYFATLTEVPIVRAFTDLGMDSGPALALLLAGPALSLPNMLVIRSIMGTRKTLLYIGLVVVMATFTGFVFGLIA